MKHRKRRMREMILKKVLKNKLNQRGQMAQKDKECTRNPFSSREEGKTWEKENILVDWWWPVRLWLLPNLIIFALISVHCDVTSGEGELFQ